MTLARQRVVGVADPYRVGAYNAIIPTTHGHNANILRISSNFPQFIVGCGDSTHRSAVGGTERKPEQSKLRSTNETIKFSVTLARQRVVGVADPYRVGAYNAIIPTTHGHGTNISCIFSNFLQSLCRVRRAAADGGTECSSEQSKLNSINRVIPHLCPQFRTFQSLIEYINKAIFVQSAKNRFGKINCF